jgi:hypothetical protein
VVCEEDPLSKVGDAGERTDRGLSLASIHCELAVAFG